MKLISWNVNGIRACLKKGFMDYFESADSDIFCIQETKCQIGQADIDTPAHVQHWNQAQKKGYSGTATFSKTSPIAVTYGMGIVEHDNEGRVITLEFADFYLVTVYTPNSQRELARLDYRMTWEQSFCEYITDLDSTKPVIICGDLNVAHNEIDLKNPKTNRKNAGFTDQERAKMTSLLDTGFVDTFRHLHPDDIGEYSWWSYMRNARANNAGWRIDYFLVSERIQDRITDAYIMQDIYGSDHCPVVLEIAL